LFWKIISKPFSFQALEHHCVCKPPNEIISILEPYVKLDCEG